MYDPVVLIFHFAELFQGYLTCDSVKVRLAAVKCVCAMLTPFLKVWAFTFCHLQIVLNLVVRISKIRECQGSRDEGLHSNARGGVLAVPRVRCCHWSGFVIFQQILTDICKFEAINTERKLSFLHQSKKWNSYFDSENVGTIWFWTIMIAILLVSPFDVFHFSSGSPSMRDQLFLEHRSLLPPPSGRAPHARVAVHESARWETRNSGRITDIRSEQSFYYNFIDFSYQKSSKMVVQLKDFLPGSSSDVSWQASRSKPCNDSAATQKDTHRGC